MTATQESHDAQRSAVADNGRSENSATDRIRDQARVVTKNVQELGGIVRDVAQEKFGDLRDGAAGYFSQGKGKACQAEDAVGGFIRERPITSVLLGAGLGLLFGRFWMRR